MRGYSLLKTSDIPKGRTNKCSECDKKPTYLLQVGRTKVCRDCYDKANVETLGFTISGIPFEELTHYSMLGEDFARITQGNKISLEEFVGLLYTVGNRKIATKVASYVTGRDNFVHIRMQYGDRKDIIMNTEQPIILMYLNYIGYVTR